MDGNRQLCSDHIKAGNRTDWHNACQDKNITYLCILWEGKKMKGISGQTRNHSLKTYKSQLRDSLGKTSFSRLWKCIFHVLPYLTVLTSATYCHRISLTYESRLKKNYSDYQCLQLNKEKSNIQVFQKRAKSYVHQPFINGC